ncbi:MAG: aminotransferase class V-fold PLP-dependent enzyme [Pseudomonadota bacterium]
MPELPDLIRAEFPSLAHSELALFDNAGGTAPCRAVIETISRYQHECPVQLGADYPMSVEATRRLEQASRDAAVMLAGDDADSIDSGNIVFGSSTTDLIGKLALALAPQWSAGDEVIVTNFDHEANIGAWRRLADRGLTVREWQIDSETLRADPAALKALLSTKTRLVAFTHASNILGDALPIGELCAMVREAGALSCVDGVGYAPHRALNVTAWNCDFYVFSLYKVFGPHCAILYGRDAAMQSTGNLNHEFHGAASPALRLAPGAFPYELAAGTSGLMHYLMQLARQVGDATYASAWRKIQTHEHELAQLALNALSARSAVRVIGAATATANRLPIISFVAEGHSSAALARAFIEHGIALRFGHFYAPRLVRACGLDPDDGVVRLSLAHYNTREEIGRFSDALDQLLAA